MAGPEIRSVLFVDDEDDIRTIAQLALRKVGGWEVHSAASGEEALAVARGLSEAPEVLLLDIMLPDTEGTALHEELRALFSAAYPDASPATIFMTARVEPKDVDRYLALGAIGVIEKPFDAMGLPAQVKSIFTKD